MGVPKFFRWLSKKYPAILSGCTATDPSATNPTGEFEPQAFDNVYLDMNGILHNSAFGVVDATTATSQMHENFVSKLESIFAAVRPTKLLFMALDGVAPRAKMNQQRTRRFMSRLTHGSPKEEIKPTVYINRPYHDSSSSDVAAMLPEDIIIKDKSNAPTFQFDSNCVTPGTDFMTMAAGWLHSFAQSKLNSGIWGEEVVIIVSDTSVPGEGEHKIIDWIRRQKLMAERTHVIYGADADLIFLGLALHVPSIHILREGTLPKSKPSTSNRGNQIRGKSSRNTIFVSELHPRTTELELGQLFETCGPIARVNIIAEGHNKTNNFGFVRFGRVTASSGASDHDISEEEWLEIDQSVSRALLMNGHKLRGKPIGVDLARGMKQSPLSEAEQLKILEQQELLTVEFMSIMGIDNATIATGLLNLAQWKMDEAQVAYFEFASSGLPWDVYSATKALDLLSQPASTASKSPIPTSKIPASPMSPSSSRDAAFSPMSPTDSSARFEDPEKDNEKDADKDDEPEDEVVGLFSPYILVNLTTLKTCFSDKFSRVSVSQATGEVVDVEAIKPVPYTPGTPIPASAREHPTSSAPTNANEQKDVLFRSFDVNRVLDDFVLLGMLFGNDFLPGLPTQDIKTGSFNRLLQDYETPLVSDGYLCESETFDFERLAKVLDLVAIPERSAIRRKIISTKKHAYQQQKKRERQEKAKNAENSASDTPLESPTPVLASASEIPSPASSVPVTPVPEGVATPETEIRVGSPKNRPFNPRRRRASKEPVEGSSPVSFGNDPASPSGADTPQQGRPRIFGEFREVIPEPTEEEFLARRAQYYVDNFPEIDWTNYQTDVEKVAHARRTICVEYLRGVSWVMRYYFLGCCSWEWYYPHHYAPFAIDVAAQLRQMVVDHPERKTASSAHFRFTLGRPLRPLEQLVAVLPPDSMMILPAPLRALVTEPSSPLYRYFPSSLHIQKSDGISGAVAKWHGVLRLPFIPRDVLIDAVTEILPKLDLTDLVRNQFCQNVAYFSQPHPLYDVCLSLPHPPSTNPALSAATSSTSQSTEDAQQIIDTVFLMPMRNVYLSPIAGKSHATLLFDL